MDYPNLNQYLKGDDINPEMMVLSDGSKWKFLAMAPPPPGWAVGDTFVIEKARGAKRFEADSLYKVINKTKGQDTLAVLVGLPANINKSLNPASAEEQYGNLNREIGIKRTDNDRLSLSDGSLWQLYNPTVYPVDEWFSGDAVVVTRGVSKSIHNTYQITNVRTQKNLIAVFLGYEQ